MTTVRLYWKPRTSKMKRAAMMRALRKLYTESKNYSNVKDMGEYVEFKAANRDTRYIWLVLRTIRGRTMKNTMTDVIPEMLRPIPEKKKRAPKPSICRRRISLDTLHREALQRKDDRISGLEALLAMHEQAGTPDCDPYMKELRRKLRAARVQREAMRP